MSSKNRTPIADNVPIVAGVLGLVSIALVVGAVRGLLPMDALPENRTLLALIPHANAAISAVAIVTILGGIRAIRRGAVDTHRRLMIASFLLFVAFLALYLYKVGVAGPTRFGGPPTVYRFLYLPVLAVHMLLAIVTLPLLYHVLLLGLTRPVSELPETSHPKVGRIAAGMWLVSFGLGIVVYLLLYVVFPHA